MYSALERQQCRVNAHNRQQHVAAERRKKEREEERRQIETLYEEEYQSEVVIQSEGLSCYTKVL